jgi:hypothetical protein
MASKQNRATRPRRPITSKAKIAHAKRVAEASPAKLSNLKLLFQLSNDGSQPEDACLWLNGYLADLISNASCLDWANDERVFTRALGEVLSNIERNNEPHEPDDDTYAMLKMVVTRIKDGETLAALYAEDEEANGDRQKATGPDLGNVWQPRNKREEAIVDDVLEHAEEIRAARASCDSRASAIGKGGQG